MGFSGWSPLILAILNHSFSGKCVLLSQASWVVSTHVYNKPGQSTWVPTNQMAAAKSRHDKNSCLAVCVCVCLWVSMSVCRTMDIKQMQHTHTRTLAGYIRAYSFIFPVKVSHLGGRKRPFQFVSHQQGQVQSLCVRFVPVQAPVYGLKLFVLCSCQSRRVNIN